MINVDTIVMSPHLGYEFDRQVYQSQRTNIYQLWDAELDYEKEILDQIYA